MRAEDRHPTTAAIVKHFDFEHLPPHLADISQHCHSLAEMMVTNLQDGPELTSGLRKLLEAKDCFVRQAIVDRSGVNGETTL